MVEDLRALFKTAGLMMIMIICFYIGLKIGIHLVR